MAHAHIIRNFPVDYPFRKKIRDNVLMLLGKIRISARGNMLNAKDYKTAKKLLRKGDIILVGTLRELSVWLIKGPLTHALICTKKRHLIHAIGHGVEKTTLKQLFHKYDIMIILRLKEQKNEKIEKMVSFTINQLGKPYNFEFRPQKDTYYCSELIYEALTRAGINIKLREIEKITKTYYSHFKINAIHPMQYITKQVDIVFMSHNLQMKDLKPVFNEKV